MSLKVWTWHGAQARACYPFCMEKSETPDQASTENIIKWSVDALKMSIEFGKELLDVQAQRRQSLEQRANQLVPVSGALLIALAGSVFGGHFKPVGGTVLYLWGMVIALLSGMTVCLLMLVRQPGKFAGFEPNQILQKYISEGGEHGILKSVSSEYQKRIEFNRSELLFMGIANFFAVLFVMAGIGYGALMIFQNRYEAPNSSAGVVQEPAQRGTSTLPRPSP